MDGLIKNLIEPARSEEDLPVSAVTEVPLLSSLFGTAQLSLTEWVDLVLLSLLPLVFHELIVLAKWIGGKAKKGS